MTHTRNRRPTPGELAQAAHALVSAALEMGEAGTDDAHALKTSDSGRGAA